MKEPTGDRSAKSASSEVPAFSEEIRWQEAAQSALAELAARGMPFTSSEVVAMVGPPPTHSLLPSLLRWGHRRDLIRRFPAALVGTIWVGAHPSLTASRLGTGRRVSDVLLDDVWPEVRARAEKERISESELVKRAIRAYLGDS